MKLPRLLRPVSAAAILAAFLASCETPPEHPTFSDIRFNTAPPIQLDVATIDVRNDYQMPFKEPNVEHLFPVPAGRAAENWAHDRLRAVGHSGRAVFVIRKASVIETALPVKEGITATFTSQPSERYDLSLEATLQIVNDQGLILRTADVQTNRSQSLLQGITPNDRDKAWYAMTKDAMADFDKQMESEIQNNFGLYYVR